MESLVPLKIQYAVSFEKSGPAGSVSVVSVVVSEVVVTVVVSDVVMTVVEVSGSELSVGSVWQEAIDAHKQTVRSALTAFLKIMFLLSIFFIRAIISRFIETGHVLMNESAGKGRPLIMVK